MTVSVKRDVFAECISKIADLAEISNDQAYEFIQRVANEGNTLRNQGVENPFDTAAEKAVLDTRYAVYRKRTDILRNAAIRNTIIKTVDISKGGKSSALNILSRIREVWGKGIKNGLSTEQKHRTIYKQIAGPMMADIKAKGYLEHFRTGVVDDEIAEVISRNNGGTPRDDIKISEPAQYIGDWLSKGMELTRQRKNAAGAHIRAMIGFIGHNTWDSRALRDAAGKGKSELESFQAWLEKDGQNFHPDFVQSLKDSITLKDGETEEQALHDSLFRIWRDFVEGNHQKRPDGAIPFEEEAGSRYIPPAYEGTFNIGRSESHQRVFQWKDSQAYLDHEQNFGSLKTWGSLGNSFILDTLPNDARHIALMEDWGTNPAGNLRTILDRIQTRIKNEHSVDEAEKFKSWRDKIETEFSFLTGEAYKNANIRWAKIYSQVNGIVASSKLGGIVIPHFMSAPFTVSSEMVHHGVSHVNSIANVLKAGLTGRSAKDIQERMSEVGAYSNGWLYPLMSEVYKNQGGMGYIPWATMQVVRLGGLHRVLDRMQAEAVERVHMNYFGENSGKAFHELDPLRQKMLQRYGIGLDEWDMLRSGDEGLTLDGQKYMTPKAASLIDYYKIKDYLTNKGLINDQFTQTMVDQAIQEYRWKLSDRYGMYLNSSASRATVTPGVREQAAFLGHTQVGSAWWMLRRSMSQFKMWAFAAQNQILNRELTLGLENKNLAANMGWIIALAAAGGTMRLAISDMIAGRPVRNMMDYHNLLQAFAAGGGLGLMGELMFGELTKQSVDPLSEFAGPVGTTAASLIQVYNQWRYDLKNGKDQATALDSAWKGIIRWAVPNIPFTNLFWLKGTWDYMVAYHLYEWATPGWWERVNRSLQKQGSPPMLGYIPGGSIPVGIPHVTFPNQGQ